MAWIAWQWPLGGPGQASPATSTLAVIGGPAIGSFPIGGSMDPLTPGVFIVLDGQLLSRRVRAETLEVALSLGGRRKLEFTHWMPQGGTPLVPGQRILIREDTVNVFRGTIDSADAVEIPGNVAVRTQVVAVDLTAILDRRRVTNALPYNNFIAGDIVRDLFNQYLDGEGLSELSVQDGPTVLAFTPKSYATVAEVLRDLSEVVGFIWYVDANGALHFEPTTQDAAPFGIGVGGVSPLQNTVSVATTRERYRNRQTVRYGEDLAFQVTVDDEDEQLARRALEGGTGIYHDVRDEADIETEQEAQALAEALLRRYGTIPRRVEFSLRTRGLRPGQLVAVNLPAYDIDGDYLVDEVVMKDEGAGLRRYDITVLSGEHQGQESLEFWRAVAKQ